MALMGRHKAKRFSASAAARSEITTSRKWGSTVPLTKWVLFLYIYRFIDNLYNIVSSYNDVRYIAMVILIHFSQLHPQIFELENRTKPEMRPSYWIWSASKWRWLLEYMKDIEGHWSRSMLQTRSRESKLTMFDREKANVVVDYRRVFHHP